jgi:hypothetical protein
MSFTKLDYCQYLLSSQINYTLTNMAEHLKSWSHDTINRYLIKGEKLVPRLLFEQVQPLLEPDPGAYLIFDDTVLEKSFGPSIEVTRKQWSGNEKSVIRGIGLVSCVYVNPETERFWVIDYRVFDPDADGKTKLDHVRDMLHSVSHRAVPFETVLMDSWYATKDLMVLIEEMAKKYYCPLKSNRHQVDDSGGEHPYRRVDALEWSEQELERAGAGARQACKGQGIPKGAQGEALPGSGASSPHGMDRYQRSSFSGFGARRATGARRALEDRGVSPGSQAVNGDRTLPVPWRAHPTQPHLVCAIGVEPLEASGLPERADHLPDQTRLAARLSRPTAQESLC